MSISTLSFNAATRATIMRLQTELKDANTEVATGRHADIGMTLGRLTGQAVQYHSQETSIDRMLESNKLVSQRMELMSDTLGDLRTTATEVQKGLTAIVTNGANSDAVRGTQATTKGALESMIGALNINITGQFLFAGAQTDQTPMKDGSAVVKAKFAEFLTAAGATAATVTPDVLKQYFSSTGYTASNSTVYKFDDLFADNQTPSSPGWNDWSTASDTPIVSRISRTETIESSLSTRDDSFRKLASAYALINNLGMENMGATARSAVAEAATNRISAGLTGLTSLETQVGVRLKRIDLANTALNTQRDLVRASIDSLEGVDTMEAGLRVTTLETQLNASLAVTGRLKNLSLLNYL